MKSTDSRQLEAFKKALTAPIKRHPYRKKVVWPNSKPVPPEGVTLTSPIYHTGGWFFFNGEAIVEEVDVKTQKDPRVKLTLTVFPPSVLLPR